MVTLIQFVFSWLITKLPKLQTVTVTKLVLPNPNQHIKIEIKTKTKQNKTKKQACYSFFFSERMVGSSDGSWKSWYALKQVLNILQVWCLYRPISLLPLISKVMEKVFHYQTSTFLNSKQLLYTYQSGFQKIILQIFAFLIWMAKF